MALYSLLNWWRQRDLNPYYNLERVMSYPIRRWRHIVGVRCFLCNQIIPHQFGWFLRGTSPHDRQTLKVLHVSRQLHLCRLRVPSGWYSFSSETKYSRVYRHPAWSRISSELRRIRVFNHQSACLCAIWQYLHRVVQYLLLHSKPCIFKALAGKRLPLKVNPDLTINP